MLTNNGVKRTCAAVAMLALGAGCSAEHKPLALDDGASAGATSGQRGGMPSADTDTADGRTETDDSGTSNGSGGTAAN